MSNFGAVGDGSIKGKVGKTGNVSNFGAVGDGSNKGNVGNNMMATNNTSCKKIESSDKITSTCHRGIGSRIVGQGLAASVVCMYACPSHFWNAINFW